MQAPMEVLEAVIDEASGNPASLRLLSLTCSAFLPRARYHLFSCIIIRSVQQMESSCQFLDSRPWLPPLVRKVTLSVLVPEDNSIPNLRLLDVVPVYLLSHLPNLRSWMMKITPYEYTDNNRPWLSLHRSALWRYQKYGGRIQNLELVNISMEDISDFMGLLSAFTGIHTLTCCCIEFRRRKDPNSLPAANMLARSLRIDKLVAGPALDICMTEYLLASSAATLNHLVITIQSLDELECPDYFGRLEVAMSQLSQLSSLTLGIPAYIDILVPWEYTDAYPGIAHDMRLATSILKCVRRDRLKDVCVDFELAPVAALGCCLSCRSDPPSEACKALEEALLTFPSCSVIVNDAVVDRRAGRTEFWYPVINGAFPKLNERGLFTFTRTPTDIPDPFGHEGSVNCLVASRDSKWIVTASEDGTIIVWDAEHGTPVQEWFAAAEHVGPVCALAFSPDSQRLVSMGDRRGRGAPVLIVWDIGDGHGGARKVATLEGQTAFVCCAWSGDGALIASASADGTARVWNAQTFQQRGPLNCSPHDARGPYHLQFSPNSRYLAWISHSPAKCCLAQPGLTDSEQPAMFFLHPDPNLRDSVPITAFAFDPESKRIATAHGDWGFDSPYEEYVARIWDIATGTPLVVLGAPAHIRWFVGYVSFSPDGRSVLSVSEWIDGSVTIFDAASGERKAALKELDSDRSPIRKACFSPDGKYIATATWDSAVYRIHSGAVRLWRTSDASRMVEFTEHRSQILHVAFSPNGEFLASGDRDGIVHIRRLSKFIER